METLVGAEIDDWFGNQETDFPQHSEIVDDLSDTLFPMMDEKHASDHFKGCLPRLERFGDDSLDSSLTKQGSLFENATSPKVIPESVKVEYPSSFPLPLISPPSLPKLPKIEATPTALVSCLDEASLYAIQSQLQTTQISEPMPSMCLPSYSQGNSLIIQTLKMHYWKEFQKLAAQQQLLQYHLLFLKMMPLMDSTGPFPGILSKDQRVIPQPAVTIADTGGAQEVPISPGSFVCSHPGCGRILKSRFSLRRHISAHAGIKPFRCNFANCGKRFAESNTLARHRRIHTGEKPFRCEIPGCNRAFSDASNWRRHETSHSGNKPFACPYDCEARYCRKTSLTNHLQKVHGRK